MKSTYFIDKHIEGKKKIKQEFLTHNKTGLKMNECDITIGIPIHKKFCLYFFR